VVRVLETAEQPFVQADLDAQPENIFGEATWEANKRPSRITRDGAVRPAGTLKDSG
jgi:hypothetical protein